MLLSDLHFGYRSRDAVIRGVSAALRAGQVCGLVGPNAAGKSTLLRLMLGHLRPQRGSVTLGDRSVAQMSPFERASRIAYVPQRTAADVAMTVAEVVALGRYALPMDEGAVGQALALCGLEGIRDRDFSKLSAGQQQRVAVARAVAQVWSQGDLSGRFMLLDEPVNAMDLKHVHAVLGLLKSLASRGLGILIVLHDLNLTAACADTVWLLAQGRLVASGPVESVLTPEVLEPIYDVALGAAATGGGARPMLFVEPSRTLVRD